MKIFPKISAQDFSDEVAEIIKSSEGIEIQFFEENGPVGDFDFEKEVIRKKEEFPNIKHITIHPPLNNYNIELVLLKDKNMLKNIFERLVVLSEKLDVSISFIFHTYITKKQFEATNASDTIRELLKILEGKNVTILLENMFMLLDERWGCSPIETAKLIDHPNLGVCIDTTHIHCKSAIWQQDFNEMIKKDLNPDDCHKYVKQIHFASQRNNDGYIEKDTHGRVHENVESVKEEIKWLREMNMFDDKNIIPEVSEDDYYSRKDQIKEINMLKEACK